MIKKIVDFLAFLPRELIVFLISILPIIELRGAIPMGTALGLPFYTNYALSVVGNLLPVPFILAFIPIVLDFMERFKIFKPIVGWVKRKANKYKGKIIMENLPEISETEGEKAENVENAGEKAESLEGVESSESSEKFGKKTRAKRLRKMQMLSPAVFCALLLFVAIHLPGTGAWTGSLVASLFGLPKRSSFIAIACGVLISGVIMCLASYGVVGFLSIFV